MLVVITKFRKWCGLSSVQDDINVTHFFVLTLCIFVENYYYYKIRVYNIGAQCVVDCNKKLINVLWGFRIILMIQGFYVGLIYTKKN
jgi:hypothetical protein